MENNQVTDSQNTDLQIMGWSELFKRELVLDEREEKINRDGKRWLERDRALGKREAAVRKREADLESREAAVRKREESLNVNSQVRSHPKYFVKRICAPIRSMPMQDENIVDLIGDWIEKTI